MYMLRIRTLRYTCNEMADLEAANAANSVDPILNIYIYKDIKKHTKQVLNYKWPNKLWTKQYTKLNQIKNNIQIRQNPGLNRKED